MRFITARLVAAFVALLLGAMAHAGIEVSPDLAEKVQGFAQAAVDLSVAIASYVLIRRFGKKKD